MKLAIGDLLIRSWRLCWRRPVVWLLGFLMTLPQACSMSLDASMRLGREQILPRSGLPLGGDWIGQTLRQRLPAGASAYFGGLDQELETLIAWLRPSSLGDRPAALLGPALMAIALFGLAGLVLGLLAYVGRAAVIRGVGEIGEDFGHLRLRQALRLGWSARTLRLLLADLLVGLGSLALLLPPLTLGILAALPGLALDGDPSQRFVSILILMLTALATLVLSLVLGIPLAVLSQLSACEILAVDAPIGTAFGAALKTIRRHFGEVARLTLVMTFLILALTIAVIPSNLLVAFGQMALGSGLGAVIKLLLGGLLGAYPTLTSLGIGMLLAGVVIGTPWMLVLGLAQTVQLSIWTLAWRHWRDADLPAAPSPAAASAVPVGDPPALITPGPA